MKDKLNEFYTTTAVTSILISLSSIAHAGDITLDYIGENVDLQFSGANSSVKLIQGFVDQSIPDNVAFNDEFNLKFASDISLYNLTFIDNGLTPVGDGSNARTAVAGVPDSFAARLYNNTSSNVGPNDSNFVAVTTNGNSDSVDARQSGTSNNMYLDQLGDFSTLTVLQDAENSVMDVTQGAASAEGSIDSSDAGNVAILGQRGSGADTTVRQFGNYNT